MSKTLDIKFKSQYSNYLELNFEIADTSILCFEIDEIIENYLKQQHKTLSENDINIKYNLLINKNKLSASYNITILSNTIDKKILCMHSANIKKEILSLEHFKNIIVITKDDANSFLCELLYPKIMQIEVRLRAIVNKIYMQTKGKEWKNEILDKTKMANNKRSKGFDLNEVLLETLVDLLFKINLNKDNSIPSNLNILSKEELIKIIHNVKHKSFWEEFFPKVKLKLEHLNLLINIRNNVMHFKPISYNDFNQNDKNCDRIIKLLSKAETQIIGNKINFSKKLLDSFNILSQAINKLVEPIQNQLNSLSNALQPIFDEINKMKKTN